MEDFAFTWSPASFLGSIDKVSAAWSRFKELFRAGADKMGQNVTGLTDKVKKSEKTRETASKESSMGAGDVINGLIGKVGALGAAYFGLSAVMRRLPEVGQTFSVAGDIMLKNFLWPLRQQLIPLLQKVLDWTRDHRAMFVRYGQVLANVFRAFYNVVMSAIKSIQTMFSSFQKTWESFFGKSKKSLLDWINVLVFQITTVMIAIQTLLAPVFEMLGGIIARTFAVAKSYFDGFLRGVGDLGAIMGSVIELFKELLGLFTTTDAETKELMAAFGGLGEAIGTVLGNALTLVIASLRTFVNLLGGAMDIIKAIKGAATGAEGFRTDAESAETVKRMFRERMARQEAIAAPVNERFGRTEYQEEGRPIAGPAATATPGGGSKTVTQNQQNAVTVNVQVRDPREIEQASRDAARGTTTGLTQQFRENINRDKAALGVSP